MGSQKPRLRASDPHAILQSRERGGERAYREEGRKGAKEEGREKGREGPRTGLARKAPGPQASGVSRVEILEREDTRNGEREGEEGKQEAVRAYMKGIPRAYALIPRRVVGA